VAKKKQTETTLLVGLGNPGDEYNSTRHNVGFTFLDSLAKKTYADVNKSKFFSLYGKYTKENHNFILSKPQTFINDSGRAVKSIKDFFKINTDKIIVIFDDLDLNIGQVRIKVGGGSAGHNGINSIIDHLQDDNFTRIRIGIGKPRDKSTTSNYVLSRFLPDEAKIISKITDIADEIVHNVVFNGISFAMNKFNSKIQ
jgi:PTH1 family peptidyl-tRNA hydrolase